MSCLPSRCRCEERLLAPFISCYNRHKVASYRFRERLDLGTHTSQPEALYVDAQSGQRLVVERKNLIWPPDYAQIHDSLHMVTSIIETAITSHLDARTPYTFVMPDTIRGSVPGLRDHAAEVAKIIVKNMNAVHAGRTVGSRAPGREWSFRVEAAHERDWDEPDDGIRYVFTGTVSPLDYGEVPDGLPHEFNRLLQSARLKFESHHDATRILVMDFHGDLQHPGSFIEQLLAAVTVPANVDEIWLSTYVLVTELRYGWIHQQLWPSLGQPIYELSGETVVPPG